MGFKAKELTSFVQQRFKRLADPSKAGPMAAYMKTEMPFYGIQKPQRSAVYKDMKKLFTASTSTEYEEGVLALWQLPHREEKYAALEFACQNQKFIKIESMPLYEQLVRQGSWWDFVDVVATNLVSIVLLNERQSTRPIIDEWIDDGDMWIRRTAILSQHRHKKKTDSEQIFGHCLRRADEKEFFIRKAIGWALREYSYAEPVAVKKFLLANRQRLSKLSFQEGAKQLVRSGAMQV